MAAVEGPGLVRISRLKRRIAASLVLGALSVASFGTTSAVAVSVAAPSAELEAVCPVATPGTAQ